MISSEATALVQLVLDTFQALDPETTGIYAAVVFIGSEPKDVAAQFSITEADVLNRVEFVARRLKRRIQESELI